MDNNLHTDELQHLGIDLELSLESDELQHHGTKGMKWGVRRYQNKDGTLTKAGQKRYNKETEKLKQEQAKYRAEKKVLSNQKKSQAKFDKLEERKQKLEADKKALAEEKKRFKNGEKETPKATEQDSAALRDKLLKSTDPNELYKNRDLLSNAELQDRINRIDMEARLQGKIPVENKPTIQGRIDKAVSMYQTIDNAYSTVSNSTIGKTLAKQLGIELPKVEQKTPDFDVNDFYKNINKKSAKEIQEVAQRLANEKKIADEIKRRQNDKQAAKDAKKAEKQAKKDAKKDAKNSNDDQQSSSSSSSNSSQSSSSSNSSQTSNSSSSSQNSYSDAGRSTVTSLVPYGSSASSFNSSYSSGGRSYTNNSSILDATVSYDSNGTMHVSYDPDDD